MNQRYFSILVSFFTIFIPIHIVSMTTSRLAIPATNVQNYFFGSTPNNSSIQQYTPTIAIEQSNKALSEALKDQEQSNKSKYSHRKQWKKPLALGAAAGLTLEMYSSKKAQAEDLDRLLPPPSFNAYAKFKLQHLKNKMLSWGLNIEEMLSPEAYLELESDDIYTIRNYYKAFNDIAQFSIDAKTFDPQLYELFLRIKKDLGITENINFRIAYPECLLLGNNIACYTDDLKIILLHKNYKNFSKIELIRILAHELEHVKQFHHYPGSYKISKKDVLQSRKQGRQSKTGAHLKIETAADASATGYLDCPKCLRPYKDSKPLDPILQHNPVDLPSGHFSTELGYFSPKDFELYFERACLDGELCQAHKLVGQPKEFDYSIPTYFDSYWNQQQIKNKMNRKYNESLQRRLYKLPTKFFLPKEDKAK